MKSTPITLLDGHPVPYSLTTQRRGKSVAATPHLHQVDAFLKAKGMKRTKVNGAYVFYEPAMDMTVYLALNEDCLRNGSFYRSNPDGSWSQYINGDFMDAVPDRPNTYCGQPLVAYTAAVARKLIPACCWGNS